MKIYSIALCLGVALATPAKAVDHAIVDGDHVLTTPALRVVIDTSLRMVVHSLDGTDDARIVAGPADDPSIVSPQSITLDGVTLTDFDLVDAPIVSSVSNHFGTGLTLEFVGDATLGGAAIRSTWIVGVYDDHPDAVVMQSTYANLSGSTSFAIDEIASAALTLDRRLSDPSEDPWSFTSVQSTTSRWRDWWLDIPLEPGFFRANELVNADNHGRGGQPFLNVRGRETGLAIASLEPEPRAIALPCRVEGDGRVSVAITQTPAASYGQFDAILDPGETASSILSAVIVHRGDFFDPAHRYGRMLEAVLADAGKKTFGPWPERVYDPYWKSWGFGLDFTLSDVTGAMDDLADLGITWIALDDGWFDFYGSWRPNPASGKFPGGDSDLVAFIDDVHTAQWGRADVAFDVHTWWYPIAWESGCGLPVSYLIEDSGGGYPLTDRDHRFLCPAYPPARDEIVATAVRFVDDYGFDGIYIDGSTLLSVPPCYNDQHGHARPIDSVEAVPDLYRRVFEAVQAVTPDAPVILCECSGPHDPYKMPYSNLEDASDPHHDIDVRKKVKFSKAIRGADAPVGDGYVDPLDYNYLSGTFANSVGVGAVLTTTYVSPDVLGHDLWSTWIDRLLAFELPRGTALNLYDVAYDRPEAYVTAVASGRRVYSFFREPGESMSTVEIRGLPPGEVWRLVDVESGIEVATVTGPTGDVPVTWHRQAPGRPEWTMLVASPPDLVDIDDVPSPGEPTTAIDVRYESGRVYLSAAVPLETTPTFQIFDVQGRRVRDLARGTDGAAIWDRRGADGHSVAAGVYFVRLEGLSSRSFILVR